MRKEHPAQVLQPHERPGAHRARRGPDTIQRRGPQRRLRRPDGDQVAHRHGLPETKSVPQVDLRQRRLRSQDQWLLGQRGRGRRAFVAAGRPLGRGEGPVEQGRTHPVGWPAAAPLHCEGPGRGAGGHPHGRAGLRARPYCHPGHRGAHTGALQRRPVEARAHTPCRVASSNASA